MANELIATELNKDTPKPQDTLDTLKHLHLNMLLQEYISDESKVNVLARKIYQMFNQHKPQEVCKCPEPVMDADECLQCGKELRNKPQERVKEVLMKYSQEFLINQRCVTDEHFDKIATELSKDK